MKISDFVPGLSYPLAGLGDARLNSTLPPTPGSELTTYGKDIIRSLEADKESLEYPQGCTAKPLQMVIPVHALENMQLEQRRAGEHDVLHRLADSERKIAAAVAARLGFERVAQKEWQVQSRELLDVRNQANVTKELLAEERRQHNEDMVAVYDFLDNTERRAHKTEQKLRESEEKNQRISAELERALAQAERFRRQVKTLEHECFVLRSRLWTVEMATQEQARQRRYENSVLQDKLNLLRCFTYAEKSQL
ncbi:hypothetical protein K461DRAFT_297308 [Myriangium duriaei CBS 260.36]|uniref:Uncharacterized protein n=1 Tax=Myriangium duriaei CBS 260.36 TaxID=1168546 RepID=A0A9P4MCJ5_9PEZI|nr:hypothetical protein K461DRAFT_297308 [Myriangium duriaei CBS 260.36]